MKKRIVALACAMTYGNSFTLQDVEIPAKKQKLKQLLKAQQKQRERAKQKVQVTKNMLLS